MEYGFFFLGWSLVLQRSNTFENEMFRLYDWQSLTARKKTKSVERVYAIASHNRVATVVFFMCSYNTWTCENTICRLLSSYGFFFSLIFFFQRCVCVSSFDIVHFIEARVDREKISNDFCKDFDFFEWNNRALNVYQSATNLSWAVFLSK